MWFYCKICDAEWQDNEENETRCKTCDIEGTPFNKITKKDKEYDPKDDPYRDWC